MNTFCKRLTIILAATVASAFDHTSCSAKTIPDDAYRVVVQDARVSVLAISGKASPPSIRRNRNQSNLDLVLAVDSNYRSKHIFYALDPNAKTLIHAINFPDQIIGAAIAKSKDWYIVSTIKHLYRVDAKKGSRKILLENTTGQVAISQDEKTLAVLGTFELGEQTRFSGRSGAMKLGVYDLSTKKWIFQEQTPIQIAEQVYFDGKKIFGVGLGGRVHSRVASSFPCHVSVDPTSKEMKTAYGVETKFGRPADKDDYVAPPQAILNRTRMQLCRQLIPHVFSNLDPAPRSGPLGPFTPLKTKDGSLFIHVHRIANDRWIRAAFKIDQQGAITTTHGGSYSGVPVRLGKNVYSKEYLDRENEKFTDLITGKEQTHPRIDDSGSTNSQTIRKLTRCGCLQFSDGVFQMLDLGGKMRWQRDGFETYKRLGFVTVSPAGNKFAFTQNENDIYVLDSKTGKTVLKIARPKNVPIKNNEKIEYRYTRSICFDASGSQIAVLFDYEAHVYDLNTGKLLHRIICDKKAYMQKIFFVAGKWMLSGFRETRFWSPDTGFGNLIAFTDTTFAHAFLAGEKRRLLLQNEQGQTTIFDLDSNKVLATYLMGNKGPSAYDSDPIPNVATYFNDQVLVIPTGRSAQFELINTVDFSVIATVHPIPVDNKLEWIVYTNDGRWDASAGADKHVLLFKGRENAGDFTRNSQREKGLLSKRLRSALKR